MESFLPFMKINILRFYGNCIVEFACVDEVCGEGDASMHRLE